MQLYFVGNCRFFKGKTDDLQLKHNSSITCTSMHMCALKLKPLLGRQFSYILLPSNSYYCVWEFVPLLPQTRTYIPRDRPEIKTKVLTLAVVPEYPVRPRIHSHLHSPHCHLGFPVKTWRWGQLSLKAKKKSSVGYKIYMPLSSFPGFPVWPTMRSSSKKEK